MAVQFQVLAIFTVRIAKKMSRSQPFGRHQILASGSNTMKQLETAVRNYSADSESERSSSPDLFQGGVYFVSKVVGCDVLYHTL